MRTWRLLVPLLAVVSLLGCSGGGQEPDETAEQGVKWGASRLTKLVGGVYDTDTGDSLVVDKGAIVVTAGLYLQLDSPHEYFEAGPFIVDVDRETGIETIQHHLIHHVSMIGRRIQREYVACKLELRQSGVDVLVTGACKNTPIDRVFRPRKKDAFVGTYRRGDVTFRVESSDGDRFAYRLGDQPNEVALFNPRMPGTAYSDFPISLSREASKRCGIAVRFERFGSKGVSPARAYIQTWDACLPAADGMFERVR